MWRASELGGVVALPRDVGRKRLDGRVPVGEAVTVAEGGAVEHPQGRRRQPIGRGRAAHRDEPGSLVDREGRREAERAEVAEHGGVLRVGDDRLCGRGVVGVDVRVLPAARLDHVQLDRKASDAWVLLDRHQDRVLDALRILGQICRVGGEGDLHRLPSGHGDLRCIRSQSRVPRLRPGGGRLPAGENACERERCGKKSELAGSPIEAHGRPPFRLGFCREMSSERLSVR